jgi:hypothetical protein
MYVDIECDSVKIYEDDMSEVVSWVQDEWLEDFETVTSIFNAIKLAYTDPAALRQTVAIRDNREANAYIKSLGS